MLQKVQQNKWLRLGMGVLGGILLGIIEIFAKAFNSNISDAVVFLVLIVVLLVKPTGLLGKVVREKV